MMVLETNYAVLETLGKSKKHVRGSRKCVWGRLGGDLKEKTIGKYCNLMTSKYGQSNPHNEDSSKRRNIRYVNLYDVIYIHMFTHV